MKFQSSCNCNQLHLHVINPNSGSIFTICLFIEPEIRREQPVRSQGQGVMSGEVKQCVLHICSSEI